MRCNVPAQSLKNYYPRNLYYPFLDSVILHLDLRFSVHDEAVMRLSLLLPANVVTANFCEVDQQSICFFLIAGTTDKSQSSVLAVAKILSKSFGCCDLKKGLQTLPTEYFSCNENPAQYSRNSSCIFCYCRTIVFYATTDKIRFANNYGSSSSGRSVPTFIMKFQLALVQLSKKFAATSCKIKL